MPNDSTQILIYVVIAILSLMALMALTLFVRWLCKILHVAFEKPLTFDDELRAQMLPTGLYIVAGRQRAGKGSFCTALADLDATYHGEERIALAQKFVAENLPDYEGYMPEHLYYSKNKMFLTPAYTETYHVDVLNVALPESESDMHFLPYSMCILEELDAVMNARTWTSGAQKKANVIDGYKWVGHNDLVIIGDAQAFSRLDAAVRALTTDIFYIINRKDYYSDDEPHVWWQRRREENHVVRTEWTFLWIKNQLYNEAETLSKFGNFFNDNDYIKKCKLVYEGNIYDRYNSKSGQAYWYKNLKEFAHSPHPESNLSKQSIDDYCLRNARRAENASADTENSK